MAPDPTGKLVNYALVKEPDPARFPDVGAWRVEVTTPTASQRGYFLHSLAVADNNLNQRPFLSENCSSSTAAVAFLENSYGVAFSKNDKPASSLSWLLPRPNIPMIVAGLVPASKYHMTVTQSDDRYLYSLQLDPTGKYTSSAQGVLQVIEMK